MISITKVAIEIHVVSILMHLELGLYMVKVCLCLGYFWGVARGGISYMVTARVWNGLMDFDQSEDVPLWSD